MSGMPLSDVDIARGLAVSPGWTLEGGALVRQYVFASFPDAIAFVTRLAFDAEKADHHPDPTISYKRVTVRWSTHDAGGITDKDFAGVLQSDAIARLLDRSRLGT
jgi:4a-hydroxytetrahydrobiopterin dehydratase